MKKKPTGFVAICQCGKTVGAMDYKRTNTGQMQEKYSVNGLPLDVPLSQGLKLHGRKNIKL